MIAELHAAKSRAFARLFLFEQDYF